ncbi:ABC transporter ATP-binding protein [Dactylosporangium sp. NBC_01737]|uniref:ABC transporter ATP-binding protein n=1 Tax=Dactylosporangium sp. NBC_01737 TaxID=2975959 RepID=UPI002E0DF0CC|nr:ABC transporter ATP-binding protein [Dactylosporangium sp. NBC_01737]
MTETMVSTDRLTRRYGTRAVVDGVSLTVHKAEVYGFLGPNGAGKTTTLRMILGLVRASSGTATVAARRTGALIEGPGFFPYLSGRDNLRVLARHRALPDSAADAALDRVGLDGRAAFRTYSLGMKQRLGVAAALLGDPELLVLDEPTNGLDPGGMAGMRGLLRDLAREGRTVLLSSHLLGEVQDICDRVGVINGGRLVAESTVAAIRGAATLFVRAAPLDAALDAATRAGFPVSVADGGLRCATEAPPLVRALVEAGVMVYEVRTVERSLEDVFFDLTDGGVA